MLKVRFKKAFKYASLMKIIKLLLSCLIASVNTLIRQIFTGPVESQLEIIKEKDYYSTLELLTFYRATGCAKNLNMLSKQSFTTV